MLKKSYIYNNLYPTFTTKLVECSTSPFFSFSSLLFLKIDVVKKIGFYIYLNTNLNNYFILCNFLGTLVGQLYWTSCWPTSVKYVFWTCISHKDMWTNILAPINSTFFIIFFCYLQLMCPAQNDFGFKVFFYIIHTTKLTWSWTFSTLI